MAQTIVRTFDQNPPSPVSSIPEIIHRASPLFHRYLVKSASLFGSFSRGEQTASSDVDLVIEFQPNTRGLNLVYLQKDLEEVFGRSVDIITTWALENSPHDTFYYRVKKDLKDLPWQTKK